MDRQNQAKIIAFQLEEAKWIDSVVAPLLPQWIAQGVKKLAGTIPGRFLHFFVDYFLIGKWMRLRIERQRHIEMLGGKRKGFRANAPSQTVVRAITVRLFRRGAHLAEKTFPAGIIIK